MATWSKFLENDCKTPQKYQIGDFVKIIDGSKSIKSKATLNVEIVGHEYQQTTKGVIHSYDVKHDNGHIHDFYPEHCIISKI